jgi:DNA-binding beta-propeller fold protein YncE
MKTLGVCWQSESITVKFGVSLPQRRRMIGENGSNTSHFEQERPMIPKLILFMILCSIVCVIDVPLAFAEDTPSLERVGSIVLKGPVGGLDHLALDARRGRLFVANTINGSLDIVDLKTGTLLKQISGQAKIRGIDYSPELDRIFVGNGTGGICNVFDADDYRLLKNLPLGDDADNVRYNPRTRRIYVVHADHELAVINADDYTVGPPIVLSKSLGAFKVESARSRMYVNAKAEGVVAAIDAEKGQVVGRFPVAPAGLNASLAIDEPNHRLFVGCRREPTLKVMDSETGKIVASVPIPGDVDDLAFDAKRKRIYASCGDGAIAVIGQVDADHYESLATIPTVKGARTSLFDPEAGRLYVAVPRHVERPSQTEPEVWIYAVSR